MKSPFSRSAQPRRRRNIYHLALGVLMLLACTLTSCEKEETPVVGSIYQTVTVRMINNTDTKVQGSFTDIATNMSRGFVAVDPNSEKNLTIERLEFLNDSRARCNLEVKYWDSVAVRNVSVFNEMVFFNLSINPTCTVSQRNNQYSVVWEWH